MARGKPRPSRGRGTRPEPGPGSDQVFATGAGTQDYNDSTPLFCLAYLLPAFNLSALDQAQKASFAEALGKRAQMTWSEILLAPRHKLGLEKIPTAQLKTTLPSRFAEELHVLAMRYHGKLPMVGVRINRVFHVLAIERHFNELYPHGS